MSFHLPFPYERSSLLFIQMVGGGLGAVTFGYKCH